MKFLSFLSLIILVLSCKSPVKDHSIITKNEDQTITFKINGISLIIDPADGAKDISLNAFGLELLSWKNVREEYYGNSLWLSPQNVYWPQPDVLDYGKYSISEVDDGKLFKSQPDTTNGFQYFKEIRIDEKRKAFIHTYRIKNISDSVQSCAAWEVTRHPKKGISFFPLSDHGVDLERAIDSSIHTVEAEGVLWHTYDPSQLGHPGRHCKTFAFGAEGWLAFLMDNVLLLKQFPNYSPGQVAEGESDVEIYVSPENDYIELEEQSAYTSLEPGEILTWTVTWYIRQVPSDIQIEPGSIELLKLARQILD